MSSPEDNVENLVINHVGGCQPPDDGLLDLPLSEDEETGVEPEFEYNNKSISNKESSKDQDTNENKAKSADDDNAAEEEITAGNYNIVDANLNNQEKEIDGEDLDKNENICIEDEFFHDGELNEDDEDDPLDDLNSEECNDIINAVLQETPQDTPLLNGVKHRRDIFAKKDNKGCSTLSIEEEFKKPLKNTVIIDALLADHYTMDAEFATKLRKYQRSLNNRLVWEKVSKEADPVMLSALLWSWLDQLREPVLNRNDLSKIVIRADKPMEILKILDNGTRYTTEYLVRFIARLQPKSMAIRTDLMRRLVASLTHQALGIQGTLRPVGMEWNKLRQGTAGQVMIFIDKLYEMVVGESNQKCVF